MALRVGDEFIYSADGDTIEIRLKNGMRTYFKGVAPIKNRKKVHELLKLVEQKGVIVGKQWFE